MSSLLDLAVFRESRWSINAYYCSKSVAFGEALKDEFFTYAYNYKTQMQWLMLLIKRGYEIISGGTDNHMMLIDLRKKIFLKRAENALVKQKLP
jgi:glycine hydroxymethyltransferase